jgi:hypothetical protein
MPPEAKHPGLKETAHGATRSGGRKHRVWPLPALVAVGVALLPTLPPLWSQQPVITPDVDIDQGKLEKGGYTLRKVLESGGQFFTTPYIPYDKTTGVGDGYGEGPDGPRMAQRKAFYPPDFPAYRFLRVNGLDSQSCYECHNSIGSYVETGTVSDALIRKPGTVGGSAGSNSNAFINPEFPNPITLLIRNPPHVFGTGYTQTLALEMTEELFARREAARTRAQLDPGVEQEVDLVAKGMSFGKFRTKYTGGKAVVNGAKDVCQGATITFGEDGYTDDVSGVTGVASDLVIRPFQWKGISSSIRHFVRDALDFHFSMQAEEKYGDLDCDKDGKIREMTLGNVSALVSFVCMTRPPNQEIPRGKEGVVKRGEEIFLGKTGDSRLQAGLTGAMCADCHTPALQVETPELLIFNPGPAHVTEEDCKKLSAGLVDPVSSYRDLELFKRIQPRLRKLRETIAKDRTHPGAATLTAKESSPKAISTVLLEALRKDRKAQPGPGYLINLTNPGKDLPNYIYPRLPAGIDQSVAVPLFSDLRTHNMGEGLQDRVVQGSDVADICIPAPVFLTRPLWGVADTGPWLHDGRALTLQEAILLHEGKGSEANPVIESFKKLSPADQKAVVEFLLTLRLPVQQDLKIKN